MQPFVDQRLIVNLAVNFVNTSILDSLGYDSYVGAEGWPAWTISLPHKT